MTPDSPDAAALIQRAEFLAASHLATAEELRALVQSLLALLTARETEDAELQLRLLRMNRTNLEAENLESHEDRERIRQRNSQLLAQLDAFKAQASQLEKREDYLTRRVEAAEAKAEAKVTALEAALATAQAEIAGLHEHWYGKLMAALAERDAFKAADREVSDAYLRIHNLVKSFDTKPGGSDRFELTERRVKGLIAERDALRDQVASNKFG